VTEKILENSGVLNKGNYLVIYKGSIMLDRVRHDLPVVTSRGNPLASLTIVRNFQMQNPLYAEITL
jgi:hypothetical protein